jgi:hypothetical protein
VHLHVDVVAYIDPAFFVYSNALNQANALVPDLSVGLMRIIWKPQSK